MSFEAAIAKTLVHEGGYVDDPSDSGGETNYGITIAVARKHGYAGDMKLLPLEKAKEIYKISYWDSVNLEEIDRTFPQLAAQVFDVGVNSGPQVAVKMLQQAISILTTEPLECDGVIGPSTIARFNQIPAKDYPVLFNLLSGFQVVRYAKLCDTPKYKKFIRGWMHRISFIGKGSNEPISAG